MGQHSDSKILGDSKLHGGSKDRVEPIAQKPKKDFSMTRYFTLLVLSIVLGHFVFCTDVAAQTSPNVSTNYHIMGPGGTLPTPAGNNRYFHTLSQLPNYVGNWDLSPFYVTPRGMIAITLHANDTSKTMRPILIDWYSTVSVDSDVNGVKRSISGTDGIFDLGSGSHLILSKDIEFTGLTTSQYGYIDMYGATLTAKGVSFVASTDSATDGAAIYSVDSFGYDEEGNSVSLRGTIDIENSRFVQNRADNGSGGAIYARETDIYGVGSYFERNSAFYGGATYLTDGYWDIKGSTANFEKASFLNNRALFGGAIFAENSDLNLKGATIKDNVAEYFGGAIFFYVSDNSSRTLTLGAFNQAVEISGNLHNYDDVTDPTNPTGDANFVSFYGDGKINVIVDTDAGGILNMRDPMSAYMNNSLNLSISKTGKGTWNLGGISDLTAIELGTQFQIQDGTFRLQDQAELLLKNANYSDSFSVQSAGKFITGAGLVGDPTKKVTLQTSHFSMASESMLQLGDSLKLQIDQDPTATFDTENVLAATISGKGHLDKSGKGTLTYSGKTANYGGNLTISEGGFKVDSQNTFKTSGKVDLGNDTNLIIALNSQT
ncbi:MAG: hypothetical protein ACRCUY_01880, partial [Thermoguttaceae bacterium]